MDPKRRSPVKISDLIARLQRAQDEGFEEVFVTPRRLLPREDFHVRETRLHHVEEGRYVKVITLDLEV